MCQCHLQCRFKLNCPLTTVLANGVQRFCCAEFLFYIHWCQSFLKRTISNYCLSFSLVPLFTLLSIANVHLPVSFDRFYPASETTIAHTTVDDTLFFYSFHLVWPSRMKSARLFKFRAAVLVHVLQIITISEHAE